MMDNRTIEIYARKDSEGRVMQLLNRIFNINDIKDSDTLIGEGYGDDYAHPHLVYQLFDDTGCHNYKLIDGKMTLCTSEDKQMELSARPAPQPTKEQLMQQQVDGLTLAVADLAYGGDINA